MTRGSRVVARGATTAAGGRASIATRGLPRGRYTLTMTYRAAGKPGSLTLLVTVR